jgi:hypothetical protein
LLKWKPGIRIKTHKSVADDMRTLLHATSLVMCHSTFSWCMALMSKSLKTLYQPSTFQVRGVDEYSIHTYEFHNYIKPGDWTASTEQLDLMLSHSIDDIRVTHRPSEPGQNNEPERSLLW